jgi:phosphatidylinositol alpha-1,6-mannosyltransferase
LQVTTGSCPEVRLRALLYHGEEAQLSGIYADGIRPFPTKSCRSNRWQFLMHYVWTCLHWRPDVVFVDHLHLAVVPFLFHRLLASPYVLFCHGIEFDGPLSALRKRAFRAAVQRLSNSRFTARRLEGLFPDVAVEPCELGLEELPLTREHILDPAIGHRSREDGRVDALPDAFGEPRQLGQRFVLIVSRLATGERYKGHDQLLAVMPRLVERLADAQLIIAGDGDDRERLQQLARASGAGQAILFAGFVSGHVLASLFARCRLFAMPSRGEGFGLVYLEAMRFAKPCIASRVDAGGEVVADGVSGLLVDPVNLQELQVAITRLLAEDALAEKLGRAGLQRLNEHYRFRHFQGRLRARLAELLPALAIGGQNCELERPLAVVDR